MSLRLRIHSKQFFTFYFFRNYWWSWCFVAGVLFLVVNHTTFVLKRFTGKPIDDNIYSLCFNSVLSISLFNLSALSSQQSESYCLESRLRTPYIENRTVFFYGRNDHKLLSTVMFIEMLKLQYNSTKIEDPQNFH